MNRLLKSPFLLLFGLIFLVTSCQNSDGPEVQVDMDLEVPNFGLHDQNGDFHTLYYYSDAKAVVLYVQQNSCPINRNAVTDLKSVRRQFKGK
ncbi:MAG: hypothetical protein AB8G86_18200, partial [Saprospiraceae bacterium]